jgi:hypothetical protein
MRLGITGFNPDAGIGTGEKAVGLGLGFVQPQPAAGFDWSNLVGDLARGWTNIGAQILVPPTYVQNAGGVEIRGGAPVLQTGYGAGPVGTAAGATGASLVTGGGQTAVGLSTNGLMLAGMGVLALVLLMQGRR